MGKLKAFIADGGWGVVVPVVILIVFIFVVRDCVQDEKKSSQELKTYIEQRDSIKREEARREEQLLKEITLHRVRFYERYSAAYHHFNDFDEFNEWLYEVNKAGFELLYKNYISRFREWSGGIDSLSNYLGWCGPVYYVQCEQCGYETEYCPDEHYFQ